VSPLFWVWQKLLFILGGLMMPLSIYPDWIQRVAHMTPFPSMLAGPAGFMLEDRSVNAATLTWQLGVWGLAIVVTAHLVFRRAVRSLQVNGG
jgi:ABC-2 type transport system permease protein